jgi:hypothetical protein
MLENKILIPLTPVHRLSLNIGLNPYPARKFRFVAGTSFLVPSPFSSPFILTPGKDLPEWKQVSKSGNEKQKIN